MNTFHNLSRKHVICTLLLTIVLNLSYVAHAQEYLTGIGNPQLLQKAQQQKDVFKSNSENKPIPLPFFEDFSNYIGDPSEKHFIDKQAFVNNTFALFPPSIGVVTLDALNDSAKIYPHLNATSKGADTLTSCYIRMDSLFLADTIRSITLEDSLYFCFYFQPGGGGIVDGNTTYLGSQPNINDSLVLEFGYTPAGDTVVIWDHIWSTPGFSIQTWLSDTLTPHQYFKQILILITNKNYLCDKFQFRFRNYASLEPQQGISGWEGNVDQWHIDYIRLDVKRNYQFILQPNGDPYAVSNDLAFVSPTTSFLKNYQAMPWQQFQTADMKSNFTNQLTNLSDDILTSTYKYSITRHENEVSNHSTGAIDINPYITDGIQNKQEQAFPPIIFPIGSLTDTTTFKITHVFQYTAGDDFCVANDTCVFEQKFSDYYAYDDGTAEYGYCLNNTFNIAKLAMKFSLRKPDELSAVRMWFNRTKNSENEEATFSIVVWKDNNGVPGDTLYSLAELKPKFSDQFLDFVEYRFDKKLPVDKNIWVGFEQKGNVQLNIGFDQNTDSREFFKFNTRGIWETSAFKGTPMLRPVFGELKNSNTQITSTSTTTIRPNPANHELRISNYEFQITKVEIFTITGMKVDEKVGFSNDLIMNVANYPSGIYFIKVYKKNSAVETLKLIKN